ncbi:MAG: hypothetical protein CSA47_01730 [Gammaproteobacteria bacterium]|nr:MAG: hypothetical protein CSA47_01730 [Gammaproteobacteria bacterium]
MNVHSKKQKKRQRIINAAIKLFVKHGIQGTSMQQLAKKAEVATGSLYNYFDNKEKLLNDIFLLLTKEDKHFISTGYDDTQSIKARFAYLVERNIRFKLAYPDKFEFLHRYVYSPAIMRAVQTGTFPPNDHPLIAVIEDGKKAGLVKPVSNEELMYFTLSGVAGFLRWKRFTQLPVTDKDIDKLVSIAWDAVKM